MFLFAGTQLQGLDERVFKFIVMYGVQGIEDMNSVFKTYVPQECRDMLITKELHHKRKAGDETNKDSSRQGGVILVVFISKIQKNHLRQLIFLHLNASVHACLQPKQEPMHVSAG